MSLVRAVSFGRKVLASQGEVLRNQPLKCLYCGKYLHLQKFPGRNEYYFAHDPGQMVNGAFCQYFEGTETSDLVLEGVTPDEFLMLTQLLPTVRNPNPNPRINPPYGPKPPVIKIIKVFVRIRNLKQLYYAGLYALDPNAYTYGDYKNKDYAVFKGWGNDVWDDGLVELGARVLDVKLLGCLNNLHPETKRRIATEFKVHNRLWFSESWQKKNGKYGCVRAFFVCTESQKMDIAKKVIKSQGAGNGTWTEMETLFPKYDLLTSGNWTPIGSPECHKICPIKSEKMCKGCLGAYCSNCVSPNQLEMFDRSKKDIRGKYAR